MQFLSSFVFIALIVQVITLGLLGAYLGTQAIANVAKGIFSRFTQRAPNSGHGH